MFGGMGGMGGRNSSLRFIRLGALAALLVGTAVFHVHGSAASSLHIIYFVVIAGVIAASFALRGRGGPGRGGPGGGRGGGGYGSGGGRLGSPPPPPVVFPENSDPESDD